MLKYNVKIKLIPIYVKLFMNNIIKLLIKKND